MTLIAAFDCGDHTQVVADSGAGDEFGGMTYRHEKVFQLGDHPLIWCVSGASHLNVGLPERLSALPYDSNLSTALRGSVAAINLVEIVTLRQAVPPDQIKGEQLLRGMVAGYWPERGAGIFMVEANGSAAFSQVPWHAIGSGAEPMRVSLEALALTAGGPFHYDDHALDAVCEAAASFKRQDVGRPFRRWTIRPDGVTRSDWIDRLLPAAEGI